jgi:hypothetical protein
VQVNLESADDLVIVEGIAQPMAVTELRFWVAEYKRKYNWDMPDSVDGVFQVRPQRVLAWLCDSSGADAGVLFSNTATEWRFQEGDAAP